MLLEYVADYRLGDNRDDALWGNRKCAFHGDLTQDVVPIAELDSSQWVIDRGEIWPRLGCDPGANNRCVDISHFWLRAMGIAQRKEVIFVEMVLNFDEFLPTY